MNNQQTNEALKEAGYPHLTIVKVAAGYQLRDERLSSLGIPQVWIFGTQTLRHRLVTMAKRGQIPVPSPIATPEQLQAASQLYRPVVWAKIEAWHGKAPLRLQWIASRETSKVLELDYGQVFG